MSQGSTRPETYMPPRMELPKETPPVDDLAILDHIEEAKVQQRQLMPTGSLDDKTTQFATHNRNSGSPCRCIDCNIVRDHFIRTEGLDA